MGIKLNINLDNWIYKLLCWYAFFVPLEKILEVFFNIDTIFKPYRVLALAILLSFGIRTVYYRNKNQQLKQDFFLYLIFIYGLVITIYKLITTQFHLGYLYNDAFQIGLYLGVFVVIRHVNISSQQIRNILKFLTVGVLINAAYVFIKFYVLQGYRRDGGFMDNPNYLALSLVVAILLLIFRRAAFAGIYKKLLWLAILGLLGYVFIISGSRTGLLVLGITVLLSFYFLSMKEKTILICFSLVIGTMLIIGGMDKLKDTGPLFLVNRIDKKKSSEDVRIPIWKGVIKASQESNFTGLGIGQFKHRFHEFYYEENNDLIKRMVKRGYFLSPHSDYLALLVVYGIIGLLSYLIFLILTSKHILERLRKVNSNGEKTHLQYCFLIFISLILFGITAENFNHPLYWILLSTSTKLQF